MLFREALVHVASQRHEREQPMKGRESHLHLWKAEEGDEAREAN